MHVSRIRAGFKRSLHWMMLRQALHFRCALCSVLATLSSIALPNPANAGANFSVEESKVTIYAPPGSPNSVVTVATRYDNFIGGEWVAPVKGQYFQNSTPVTGQVFTEIARSTSDDVELALDAAHGAKHAWGKTSAADRALVLNRIADRLQENLEPLAIAETWDNGKPIRETLGADLPLAIDHFRYFAGAIRAQEGGISEIDGDTVAYHLHEPLGVVAQIIPWNFPILMAVWKLAPALAAGNCIVMKPAEQTPW